MCGETILLTTRTLVVVDRGRATEASLGFDKTIDLGFARTGAAIVFFAVPDSALDRGDAVGLLEAVTFFFIFG